MSRLIVGPFNRVEGDLEVRLDIQDDHVEAAHVVSPLYRGFEHILIGKDPRDALVYAPRICGICSLSQSVAAANALGAAQGVTPSPNGRIVTNLVLAVENILDHLTHFYLFFMPDFTRETYGGEKWFGQACTRFAALKGEALRDILPARARFLHIVGLLAGKWPHSLAIQPGGTTRTIAFNDVLRIRSLIANFRNVIEGVVFGASLDEIADLKSQKSLEDWQDSRPADHSDFTRFLTISRALSLHRAGRSVGRFMSYGAYGFDDGPVFATGVYEDGVKPLESRAIREDISHAWMMASNSPLHPYEGQTRPDTGMKGGYSWCKAPRLSGQVVEVGALARQMVAGHPLIRDLVDRQGGSVHSRIIARLLEMALVVQEMEKWLEDIDISEPFCTHGAIPETSCGAGLVEAARGALGHWLKLEKGRIGNYQIIAPTTWNFSPRDRDGVPGPLEQALVGARVRPGETEPVSVQHIVRSFDPCMVCTVH